MRNPDKYWNPYLAGVALGLVLLAAYVFVGKGLGASGPALRFATDGGRGRRARATSRRRRPSRTSPRSRSPLANYFVFLGLGTLLGGLVAAYTAGRLRAGVTRGPSSPLRPAARARARGRRAPRRRRRASRAAAPRARRSPAAGSCPPGAGPS